MTHRVSHETLASERAAYSVECRYPDGKEVLYVGILELRGGLIAGEIGVQAWDR
jgi:hypothetical protein